MTNEIKIQMFFFKKKDICEKVIKLNDLTEKKAIVTKKRNHIDGIKLFINSVLKRK